MSRASRYYKKHLDSWRFNLVGFVFIGPIFVMIPMILGLLREFYYSIFFLLIFTIIMELITIKISYRRRLFVYSRFSRIQNQSNNSQLVIAIERALQSLKVKYSRNSKGDCIPEWPLLYTEIFSIDDKYFIAIEREIDQLSMISFGKFYNKPSFFFDIISKIDENILTIEQHNFTP